MSRLYLSPSVVSFSCFSPTLQNTPRVGDIVNGGIDIHHSVSGEFATQIRCFLIRLICQNGATTHICCHETKLRSRRLSNHDFDQAEMMLQVHKRLQLAWQQVASKLTSLKKLLEKPRLSLDFLRHQRTRFSLNKHVLDAIEAAIEQDEFEPTHTQYDWLNAISRVATHDDALNLKIRRNLMVIAGEYSQQHAHQCEQCGNWLIDDALANNG